MPPAPTEGDVYVVAKGDNPYSIAKKLHVSYNELIAINEIKDPTRVQIGQKLKIPATKKLMRWRRGDAAWPHVTSPFEHATERYLRSSAHRCRA